MVTINPDDEEKGIYDWKEGFEDSTGLTLLSVNSENIQIYLSVGYVSVDVYFLTF
jgi:hypothetical protein